MRRLSLLVASVCVFLLSLAVDRLLNPPPPDEITPDAPTVASPDPLDVNQTLTRPPKAITAPFNLRQTQHVYSSFKSSNSTGISVSELMALLPVVSVLLSPEDVDRAHRDFDLDRDESLSVLELMSLINLERSPTQRTWRMFASYGWVLFVLLLLSNALGISWVEGRMFASAGAYSKYMGMNSSNQRAWDSKRSHFLSTQACRQRLTWYLINYLGGALTVGAVSYLGGSLTLDMVWWFLSGVVMAPVCSWLLLRLMDWCASKKRRLLHKRRVGSSRMKASQRKFEREAKAQAPKPVSTPVVGGSRRPGRISRAEMPKRRAELRAEMRARREEVNSKRARVASDIEALEAALEEDAAEESLKQRAQVQLQQLREEYKALAVPLTQPEVAVWEAESSAAAPVVLEVEQALLDEVALIKQQMPSLNSAEARATAQKRIVEINTALRELVPEMKYVSGECEQEASK